MALQADHAHFAPLTGAEFIVLTTYRRSGVAVPTPVWFAHVDGVLYVTTGADAGKVKRLRANPVVQVAASDRVGTVLGSAVAGHGRVLERDEEAVARTALQQKYGAQFTTLTAQMDANRPPDSRIYLVIGPG
jgi:PPOX class probable F420-dependent enzyme